MLAELGNNRVGRPLARRDQHRSGGRRPAGCALAGNTSRSEVRVRLSQQPWWVRWLANSALLAVILAAVPSLADEPTHATARLPERVRVLAPECARAPVDVDAFLRLLRIELREDGMAWVADAAPAASVSN